MINRTIARLDRRAEQLGLALLHGGPNVRVLYFNGRKLKYRPGGQGIVRVDSYCDGRHEATCHKQPEYMERLFLKAIQE